MQFVRRASLVFSLVLIVAIAVGYVARTAGLERDRDRGLTAAAEIGAARLTSIVDATTVAARSATEPQGAADALAGVDPDLGVCVVTDTTVACAGSGPMPTDDVIADTEMRRADVDPDEPAPMPDVTVYDSLVTISAEGPAVSVLVSAPVDAMDDSSGSERVSAATLLPPGATPGGFAVDRGIRQTAAPVTDALGVYIVAAVPDDVQLPVDEYRFYVLIFSLAVLLLLLAGITLWFEQRSLLERASFDPLTKLPNRSEFERRAANLIAPSREGDGACLMLFDLNKFKQVNDTHGHLVGDELLRVVGSRLRKAVRDDDVVARWGGDEFVVVMPGVTTEEMGSRRALELAEQVSGRTRLDGVAEALRVKVSVGVAIWPTHGVELDDLVIAADQAMYEAKRDGVTSRVAAPLPPHDDALLVASV